MASNITINLKTKHNSKADSVDTLSVRPNRKIEVSTVNSHNNGTCSNDSVLTSSSNKKHNFKHNSNSSIDMLFNNNNMLVSARNNSDESEGELTSLTWLTELKNQTINWPNSVKSIFFCGDDDDEDDDHSYKYNNDEFENHHHYESTSKSNRNTKEFYDNMNEAADDNDSTDFCNQLVNDLIIYTNQHQKSAVSTTSCRNNFENQLIDPSIAASASNAATSKQLANGIINKKLKYYINGCQSQMQDNRTKTYNNNNLNKTNTNSFDGKNGINNIRNSINRKQSATDRFNKFIEQVRKIRYEYDVSASVYLYDACEKPPFNYSQIIAMAMLENGRMTLQQICSWIESKFAYYKKRKNWNNSIRHNLSLQFCFQKINRNKYEKGKGGYWELGMDLAKSERKRIRNRKTRNLRKPALIAASHPNGNETNFQSFPESTNACIQRTRATKKTINEHNGNENSTTNAKASESLKTQITARRLLGKRQQTRQQNLNSFSTLCDNLNKEISSITTNLITHQNHNQQQDMKSYDGKTTTLIDSICVCNLNEDDDGFTPTSTIHMSSEAKTTTKKSVQRSVSTTEPTTLSATVLDNITKHLQYEYSHDDQLQANQDLQQNLFHKIDEISQSSFSSSLLHQQQNTITTTSVEQCSTFHQQLQEPTIQMEICFDTTDDLLPILEQQQQQFQQLNSTPELAVNFNFPENIVECEKSKSNCSSNEGDKNNGNSSILHCSRLIDNSYNLPSSYQLNDIFMFENIKDGNTLTISNKNSLNSQIHPTIVDMSSLLTNTITTTPVSSKLLAENSVHTYAIQCRDTLECEKQMFATISTQNTSTQERLEPKINCNSGSRNNNKNNKKGEVILSINPENYVFENNQSDFFHNNIASDIVANQNDHSTKETTKTSRMGYETIGTSMMKQSKKHRKLNSHTKQLTCSALLSATERDYQGLNHQTGSSKTALTSRKTKATKTRRTRHTNENIIVTSFLNNSPINGPNVIVEQLPNYYTISIDNQQKFEQPQQLININCISTNSIAFAASTSKAETTATIAKTISCKAGSLSSLSSLSYLSSSSSSSSLSSSSSTSSSSLSSLLLERKKFTKFQGSAALLQPSVTSAASATKDTVLINNNDYPDDVEHHDDENTGNMNSSSIICTNNNDMLCTNAFTNRDDEDTEDYNDIEGEIDDQDVEDDDLLITNQLRPYIDGIDEAFQYLRSSENQNRCDELLDGIYDISVSDF